MDTSSRTVVEETADYTTWQTEDGQMLRASCLVGADGIHSSVRKYLDPDPVPKFTNMAGINASVPSVSVTHFGKKISKPLTIIARGVGAFVVAPQEVHGSELSLASRDGWKTRVGRGGRISLPIRNRWSPSCKTTLRRLETSRSLRPKILM